jgi:type VI secretion system protein ImpL
VSAEYIIVLGKIHGKLEALFGAGTQWDQVKAYIDSIANNLGSNEFQEGYRATATANKVCQTKSTRPIAPLLEQPLRQTWAAILAEAGIQLDGVWKTQVAEVFHRDVENHYPFNPMGQDIPISLLAQYFKPREGLLAVFQEKELKMFLNTSGTRLVPKTLINSQIDFSPAFLQFLERVGNVRTAIYGPLGADASVAFDLTPEGTQYVNESRLELDGQQLIYRNERQVPTAFSWPSKSGAPQAKLSIAVEGTGERPSFPPFDGEWALFRLFGRARVVSQGPTTYSVVWPLTSSDGRKFEVKYKLQARNVQNPFAQGFFEGLHCPDRATLGAAGAVAGLPTR